MPAVHEELLGTSLRGMRFNMEAARSFHEGSPQPPACKSYAHHVCEQLVPVTPQRLARMRRTCAALRARTAPFFVGVVLPLMAFYAARARALRLCTY